MAAFVQLPNTVKVELPGVTASTDIVIDLGFADISRFRAIAGIMRVLDFTGTGWAAEVYSQPAWPMQELGGLPETEFFDTAVPTSFIGSVGPTESGDSKRGTYADTVGPMLHLTLRFSATTASAGRFVAMIGIAGCEG